MNPDRHALDPFPFVLALLSSLGCTEPSRTVEIHGNDYAFVAPGLVPPGTTIFRFINDGSVLHVTAARERVIMELGHGEVYGPLCGFRNADSLPRHSSMGMWAVLQVE